MSTYSDRLRDERKRLGLNQTELAALAGVQKGAQVNYEAGKRAPDADYLIAIAAAGANVLYILTGDLEGPAPVVLNVEEQVMLDYFRQASPPIRKAALGALLSAAPTATSAPALPKNTVSIGKLYGTQTTGDVTNHGPITFGVSPPTKTKKPK